MFETVVVAMQATSVQDRAAYMHMLRGGALRGVLWPWCRRGWLTAARCAGFLRRHEPTKAWKALDHVLVAVAWSEGGGPLTMRHMARMVGSIEACGGHSSAISMAQMPSDHTST